MRMWMCDPRILCRKHLCGMHVELHMFIGSMNKGIGMKGFIENDLLEPLSIKECHEIIANEMIKRGYKHKSGLNEVDVNNALKKLSEEYLNHKINREASLKELIGRCDKCKELYYEFV